MRDRPEALLEQKAVTGLDFVFVQPDQVNLDVHFRVAPSVLEPTPLVGDLVPGQVRIERSAAAGRGAAVPVEALAWNGDVLRITTTRPGDFVLYRLTIDDPRIDPYFNGLPFSFKAGCQSDLDCRERPRDEPREPDEPVSVDYRARDYGSFRRALLDFASLRHPGWRDNGRAADGATMLVELLSALADELAYYQDRVGREAHLQTATQRRSVRRHLRLVDYHLHDGLGARAWIDVEVRAGQSGVIPAGTDVVAVSDSGAAVGYEIGRGLHDAGPGHGVDARRNSLAPHVWDEDDVRLGTGATELTLSGSHAAALPLEAAGTARPGRWALLRGTPDDPAREPRAHLVRLVSVVESTDPVFGEPITTVAWEEAQATPFELDLRELELRGNLVPATAGRARSVRFSIGANSMGLPRAVERSGPGGAVAFLFTLPDPDREGLVWTGTEPHAARPELRLVEEDAAGGIQAEWRWERSLVGAGAQAADARFELDDGTWRRVVGFRRRGAEIVHFDYADGEGATIRFGDGEFGRAPARGTTFRAEYRVGNGRRGNVAAASLVALDPPQPFVERVTNPLPGAGGDDPETIAEAVRLGPEAFRALAFRAVRPEDYAEAAERLPWVQRAGASFRWTGSWLSAFVTPDPRGAVTLEAGDRAELVEQLDRFRQVGRPVHVPDPRYADVDLELTVCVEPTALPAEVEEQVLERLSGGPGGRPGEAFFAADNFTFGTPLARSALEAAVQRVPGVRAVEAVRLRRRGHFDWRPFEEPILAVAGNEVLRLENDPRHPDRGSLTVLTRGGA
jgi:hypothetical protein